MQRPQQPNKSMVVLRWLIVGLSAALGIALIARGNVVIGGLVLVLAAARAWVFIVWRRELSERFPRGWRRDLFRRSPRERRDDS